MQNPAGFVVVVVVVSVIVFVAKSPVGSGTFYTHHCTRLRVQ